MAWPWHVLCILNTSGLWLELKFILQQQLKDRSRSGAVVQGNVKERKKTRSKRRLPARKSSLEQLRIKQQWEDNTGKGELGGSVMGSAGKGCSQWAALRLHSDINSVIYPWIKVFYCPWKGLSQRCPHSALPGVSPDGTMPIVGATTSSRHGKWEWTHIVQLLFENCRNLVQSPAGWHGPSLQAAPVLVQCCTIPAGEGLHGQLTSSPSATSHWAKWDPATLCWLNLAFSIICH